MVDPSLGMGTDDGDWGDEAELLHAWLGVGKTATGEPDLPADVVETVLRVGDAVVWHHPRLVRVALGLASSPAQFAVSNLAGGGSGSGGSGGRGVRGWGGGGSWWWWWWWW